MSTLPWMVTAQSLIGTKEDLRPRKNNNIILTWAKKIGGWISSYYNEDSIPWCGLFVGHCMAANGIKPPEKLLAALEWKSFGVVLKEPCYGCVMVFRRTGGGHVGFYMGEDKNTYHILGGNQSDSVSIARVAKSQYVAARWPAAYTDLITVGRIVKAFDETTDSAFSKVLSSSEMT